MVSVSATRGASGELVAVALGYAAGSALVLLAIAYGGRRVIDRLRAAGRGPAVQRALGVVMVLRRSRWPPTSTCAFRPRWPTSFPPS